MSAANSNRMGDCLIACASMSCMVATYFDWREVWYYGGLFWNLGAVLLLANTIFVEWAHKAKK